MKYVLIAGALILIGFIVVLQFIPIGIEPLTEMYFENHTKLPAYIFFNKTYDFAFSVRNLEYRNMSYEYSVILEYNETRKEIDSGTFTIANNETRTINESFVLLERADRYRMNVTLVKDNNESIDLHFWMEPVKGPGITITPD